MKPFPSIEFSKGQPKIEWRDFPLLRGKKLEKKGFGSAFSPSSADVFRDNSRTNRTAENGPLGVECCYCPDFSGRQMRSPVSTTPQRECNALINR
jgi:hypothetical protein